MSLNPVIEFVDVSKTFGNQRRWTASHLQCRLEWYLGCWEKTVPARRRRSEFCWV